jgi:PIN domain nuclease of toxin-antitoxin system
MENALYLDTHAVVWLYNNELHKFSQSTLELIKNSNLLISPMVILELEYLYEIKRLNTNATVIFKTLQQEINLQTCSLHFSQVITLALKQNWTRDPFDRIIVAQTAINQSMLVSKDEMIHENYDNVIWF